VVQGLVAALGVQLISAVLARRVVGMLFWRNFLATLMLITLLLGGTPDSDGRVGGRLHGGMGRGAPRVLAQSSLRVSVFVQWVWTYVTGQRGSRLIVNHHPSVSDVTHVLASEHRPLETRSSI